MSLFYETLAVNYSYLKYVINGSLTDFLIAIRSICYDIYLFFRE